MRKHASSWMIKVILGAIIISFAFFFGYNRLDKMRRSLHGLAEGQPAATVNDIPISANEFNFFFENNIERLKEAFKGNDNLENMKNFVRSMTIQQLVDRTLRISKAKELGITVTDAELAMAIRKNMGLMNKGEFDPIFYKHQYLPYFENRYGINYEELLRQDIILEKFDSIFASLNQAPAAGKESFMWKFEVAAIKNSEPDAAATADSLMQDPKNWKKFSGKKNVDIKTVGPITIAERTKILGSTGTLDDFKEIFALNSKQPVIKTPIKQGDSIFVVRLIEKNPSSAVTPDKTDFLASWMQQEMAKAKLVNYLQQEK